VNVASVVRVPRLAACLVYDLPLWLGDRMLLRALVILCVGAKVRKAALDGQ